MPRTRSIAWAQLKLGIIGVVAIALATAMILAVGGQGGFFWQRYPIKALFNDDRPPPPPNASARHGVDYQEDPSNVARRTGCAGQGVIARDRTPFACRGSPPVTSARCGRSRNRTACSTC